jgi:hypothetical protein
MASADLISPAGRGRFPVTVRPLVGEAPEKIRISTLSIERFQQLI